MSASQQQISQSELEIMRVIWQMGGRALFSPLMEELERQGKQWKANTVLTFLTRLAEKGILAVEKQGRLNEYRALVSESDYMHGLTQSFVTKVYGGDAKGLVASLLRQDALSREDMDELRSFWEEAKTHE